MSTNFIFKQIDRNKNWETQTNLLNRAVFDAKKQHLKDFEVEIRELKKKRSGNQLRAYWVLIRSVTDWMNDKGNHFTNEQVSNWMKIQSGHCTEIEGQAIPGSIANKSDCSREQMEILTKIILVFGAENLINGCQIEDRDLKELLNYYD